MPEKDRQSKLSPTALPGFYLGVDHDRNGHHVHIPSLERTTAAYHVVFNENRTYANEQRSKVYFDTPESTFEPIGRTRREYTEQPATESPADNNADDEADQSPDKPVDDPRHGAPDSWNDNHCENSQCLYPRGHDGPCSHEEVRTRFRPRPRRVYAECIAEDCTFCADHSGPCVDKSGCAIGDFLAMCDGCAVEDDVDSVPDDPSAVHVIFDDCSGEFAVADAIADPIEPTGFNDATTGPLADRWWESMRAEIKALLAK